MALMPVALLATAAAAASNCSYTAHPNVTFLGVHANVIECQNNEGLAHCQARCSADDRCAGFGLYVRGERTGRCCTKYNRLGPAGWSSGTSYTKQVHLPACPFVPTKPPPPPGPLPPSAPVAVSVIFGGNASFPYNKGAMIQPLPGGLVAAACQAGGRESSADQRILYAVSQDGGHTFPESWAATAPEASGVVGTQWEPTLFLAPNGTLWLFYSQGPAGVPNLLFAQTTTASSSWQAWSPPRLIFNVTAVPKQAGVGQPVYMYPISRVVISPIDGAWLLPSDWGCGGKAAPTGAFTVRSSDQVRALVRPGTIPTTFLVALTAVLRLGTRDSTGPPTQLSLRCPQTRTPECALSRRWQW